jgi:hypothetical protein
MALENAEKREEVMKARTHSRWGKRVALGLAVAAIAAPAAQGAYEPLYQHEFLSDGTMVEPLLPTVSQLQQFRTYWSNPAEATHPFSFTPSNEPVGPTVVIPDPTRGLPSAGHTGGTMAFGDLQFRSTPEPIVTPVASTPSSGIDWTDVGIGAAMALGAILLGAVAALGLRRRRPAHF